MRISFIVFVLSMTVSSHASDMFLIKSELSQGSELLGAPSIAVEAGIPAKVKVGDLYELTFLATPYEPGSVLISANIIIAGEDNFPSLFLDLDQHASIRFGDTRLELAVSRWFAPD